jgi:site-specific DNA-methyltransferase (adenine-specific)
LSVFDIKTDRAHLMLGDCLERMAEIPDGSVDMILTDPPYGTTACKWDSVIDLPQMWVHLKRIIKPNGAIVMTAAQPFTTTLISSNMKMFKYCWVWDKKSVTGFANAKRQPLRHIEDVVVFGTGQQPYNPQGLQRVDLKRKNSASDGGASLKGVHISTGGGSLREAGKERTQEFTNYPRQALAVPRESGTVHPTQKPVALMEYLIKTYTNEAETVLDFTMGSGTTGVACAQTGRKFIGIEQGANYYGIAAGRVLGA